MDMNFRAFEDRFLQIEVYPQEKRCFLCGTDQNLSNEHLVPRWVQRRFNLFNKRFSLPNGLSTEYGRHKVPACIECNGTYLSQLENIIRTAVVAGFDACLALDNKYIFLWMAKIALGNRFRQATMRSNPADPLSAPLFSKADLEATYAVRMMLQAVRGRAVIYRKPSPFSAFVVRIYDLPGAPSFGYMDFGSGVSAIRLGPIGFVVASEDFGMADFQYGDWLEMAEHAPLHIEQFEELAARVAYQARSIINRPAYSFLSKHSDLRTVLIKLSAGQQVRSTWVMEECDAYVNAFLSTYGLYKPLGFDEHGKYISSLFVNNQMAIFDADRKPIKFIDHRVPKKQIEFGIPEDPGLAEAIKLLD